MLNSPMLSIFQHFQAIPLRSPLISLRSKWRLTGFSRRFTPKNPVRLHNPFGELPRWGAKNVLPLNLIVFPIGKGFVSGIPLSPSNLRPFGAPPSIGRREYPREPLPLEGAAERSEAGLAFFWAAKPPPLCLPHAGKALSVGILFPHMRVFALTMREKRYPRFAAFPLGIASPYAQ